MGYGDKSLFGGRETISTEGAVPLDGLCGLIENTVRSLQGVSSEGTLRPGRSWPARGSERSDSPCPRCLVEG